VREIPLLKNALKGGGLSLKDVRKHSKREELNQEQHQIIIRAKIKGQEGTD